ncbi:hypothetical protein [Streptomyces sp. NBC_00724]|uniref:hypothetical protein n=1 Tax=Streptomyces sp. NBC_00724 TaxID=2975812 RepID=UPI002ED1C14D|nr:hypothetical protein OHB17_00385 [Streptomyces sp. NBC_00724]WTI84846.1 hypothetical protein OHB17_00525 [Streptomyces sp. NBC_00724]WTI92080.1 hypothetical protein OHB17_41480 [Streptomyces sp. NBC_00724]WTI92105.1 hypothetical protein OHB17_41620 [Streptomyces sp. NBC_00724]
MWETFWTAIGSVGTALALGGVVWQAMLTRKALEVSQLTALDAIRTRLDSEAPKVSLTMEVPEWEPLAWTPHGMPCNPWPRGQEWHFPRDEGQQYSLVLQQVLVLENLSDRRVEARFVGDLVVSDEERRPRAVGVMVLEPGEKSEKVYLQRDFTIKELAENFTAKQAGAELLHRVVGTVTVEDDRDNGNTDRWDLLLTGCPIHPDPGRDGVWTIARHHLTEGSGLRTLEYTLVPPRQRTHWLSRAQDRKLPEPGQL